MTSSWQTAVQCRPGRQGPAQGRPALPVRPAAGRQRWTPAQIEFLANIARLHRSRPPENLHDSAALLAEHFPDGRYVDVPGLCKAATLDEIEAQGWSLNPGRYVGVAARAEENFDFKERLEELNEELEALNGEARELEERIAENVAMLLKAESP